MVESRTVFEVGGYDVPSAAIEAARVAIGPKVPESVDSPELTGIVLAVLGAALPFFIAKQRGAGRAVHYHVPDGYVLNADGDSVRIEPWCPIEQPETLIYPEGGQLHGQGG